MPVPKEKTSRSKRDMRRAWHNRMDPPTVGLCPKCNEPRVPHHVCPFCGFYRGREIFPPREEAKTEAAKK